MVGNGDWPKPELAHSECSKKGLEQGESVISSCLRNVLLHSKPRVVAASAAAQASRMGS
jgi:hypothetical protein